jgi:hypothetical protein
MEIKSSSLCFVSEIELLQQWLFLRKLVLGIPAQASGKNLTRPPMPSAPRFVLVTSSRPNKGSEHWLQACALVLSGRRAKKPIHDGSQKNELNGYNHKKICVSMIMVMLISCYHKTWY